MLTRTFLLAGVPVHMHTFDNGSYYYPSFNTNVEFKVSSDGFRKFSHYIRTVILARSSALMQPIVPMLVSLDK